MVRPPTRQRCIAIARMILGDHAPDHEVTDLADWMHAIAPTLPPLTADQQATLAVLLRA